ncbi:MAG: NAD(P)-dependent oxidoreductase [Planctomyces sp.]|nr:NAD(P)-dependent oxidoreductase [Planctomyces sp.]
MSLLPDTPPQSIDELHERVSRPSDAVIRLISQHKGNICILGAGGKMGFHLTKMLNRAVSAANANIEVLAVSRFQSPSSVSLFHSHGLRTYSADLLHEAIPEEVLECRTVFFLAGVKFGTSNDPQRLYKTNVVLPRRVTEEFRDANIVALSTGCVYPFVRPDTGGSRETDSADAPGEYAQSCLGRETVFQDSGVRSCLIRLNYSVDLQYGVLVDIAVKVQNREPIDLQMGYVNAIWQGDALNTIVLAIQSCDRPSAILNLTGPEILSVRDVAQTFGNLMGVPVEFRGCEAPTAWLNHASKAHQLYGTPTVNSDLLISWIADWVRNKRPLLGKPTQFEIRNGKY